MGANGYAERCSDDERGQSPERSLDEQSSQHGLLAPCRRAVVGQALELRFRAAGYEPGSARPRWLHFGPIGPRSTPLVAHTIDGTPTKLAGGNGAEDIRTFEHWRAHVGASVDMLVSKDPPPAGFALPWLALPVDGRLKRVYVVAAYAWRGSAYPCVGRRPDEHGRMLTLYAFAEQGDTAASIAECLSLADLLAGRSGRRGRPSRYADGAWRETAERAERIKAERPGMSYDEIADALHLARRTLGNYRRQLRRERAQGHMPDLTFFLGG